MKKRKKIVAWLQSCPYPEFVTPETAELAQKKGFLVSTATLHSLKSLYEIDGYMPDLDKEGLFEVTQVNIQKWLREKHDMHISIQRIATTEGWYYCGEYGVTDHNIGTGVYSTYEKTLEVALYEALKLLKKSKN